jgi:hypothetical protein
MSSTKLSVQPDAPKLALPRAPVPSLHPPPLPQRPFSAPANSGPWCPNGNRRFTEVHPHPVIWHSVAKTIPISWLQLFHFQKKDLSGRLEHQRFPEASQLYTPSLVCHVELLMIKHDPTGHVLVRGVYRHIWHCLRLRPSLCWFMNIRHKNHSFT